MKKLSIHVDDETVEQMKELADLWGLPDIRHNTAVIQRCVERVWMLELGAARLKGMDEKNASSIDNT